MINLYDSKATNFNNNGLVVLSDCISCTTTEELNGAYEVVLEYPLDERGKWEYLLEGNILKVDGQLFRIYHKTKNLTSLKVNARHIYYDLMDNLLEDVRPTNITGEGALDWILGNTQYEHNFISMGDVGGLDTRYFVRKNPVEAIMGTDGIISTWGGELVRDNFTIKLRGARGLDRGVLIAYGKNIKGIEETLEMDGVCTRLMPIGKDGLLLTNKYIDSPYINNFAQPKIKVVEFSDAEDIATLESLGNAYIADSKTDIPQFNYKVDFLELTKTEEYKNYSVLERVYLGDTVTIKHSKLNINLKAKVIKITKNNVTNKIEKIELGSFKPNISSINTSIQSIKKDIVQVKSDYQIAIDNATSQITGAKGGNVVIRQDANKKPYEILIMDTQDVLTAEKVWRWNIGGLGYSSTGVNGPYGLAMTQDGAIVADFITTGSLNAGIIKAGIITSADGSCSINLATGVVSFNKGIIQGLNSNWNLDTGEFTTSETIDNEVYEVNISGGKIQADNRLEITSPYVVNIRNGSAQVLLSYGADTSKRNVLVAGDSVHLHAITGSITMTGNVIVWQNMNVEGDFAVTGTKNCIQKTETYGERLFYSVEDTDSYLTYRVADMVSTGINTEIRIDIDSIYKECVNLEIPYIVEINKVSFGDYKIKEQTKDYFTIESDRTNFEFKYTIVAKRKGYEDRHLDEYRREVV